MYDNTKPINAELVMDPSDVSLDVNMNYDIGKNIIILYDRCCLIKILCVKFLPIYIFKCRHFNWHTCMFKTELFILLLDRPNFGIIFENTFSFTFFSFWILLNNLYECFQKIHKMFCTWMPNLQMKVDSQLKYLETWEAKEFLILL